MSQNKKMLDQEVLKDPVSQDPVNPPGGCLQVTPYQISQTRKALVYLLPWVGSDVPPIFAPRPP